MPKRLVKCPSPYKLCKDKCPFEKGVDVSHYCSEYGHEQERLITDYDLSSSRQKWFWVRYDRWGWSREDLPSKRCASRYYLSLRKVMDE